MHCPKCGQQQVSEHTRFCSRCGFLLSGVADVIANNGIVIKKRSGFTGEPGSRKRRGVKQGMFLFLLTFLVVPLLLVLAMIMREEPVLALIGLILFGIGGLVRTAYALMFESGEPISDADLPLLPGKVETRGVLPPSRSEPASAYTSPAGVWRDTNDLQATPGSVTDSTTKLLEKEQEDQ